MAILGIINTGAVHSDAISKKHDESQESDEDWNAQWSKDAFENEEPWGYKQRCSAQKS